MHAETGRNESIGSGSRWRPNFLSVCLVVLFLFGVATKSTQSAKSSSIFSSIVRQSSKALAATARGSTHLAADLVRPKEVDWDELVGWWRLDIARTDDDDDVSASAAAATVLDEMIPSIVTLEITRHGRARYTDARGQRHESMVEFRPAAWPRSAKLKFGAVQDQPHPSQGRPRRPTNNNGIVWECTIQRKLANSEIIKLRGKIYLLRRFRSKVQIGTFLGRRRVVIKDDVERENEDDDDEEEEEEEYDYEGDEAEDETKDYYRDCDDKDEHAVSSDYLDEDAQECKQKEP